METQCFAAKRFTARTIGVNFMISDVALEVGGQGSYLGKILLPHRLYNAKALFSGSFFIHSLDIPDTESVTCRDNMSVFK
jgi:hypothetical protein